jgi:hypothetical protein
MRPGWCRCSGAPVATARRGARRRRPRARRLGRSSRGVSGGSGARGRHASAARRARVQRPHRPRARRVVAPAARGRGPIRVEHARAHAELVARAGRELGLARRRGRQLDRD